MVVIVLCRVLMIHVDQSVHCLLSIATYMPAMMLQRNLYITQGQQE